MIIGQIISVVGTLTSFLPVLGGAFTLLTGPIGLVVAAVAGAIAIGVALWKNWDEVKAFITNIWNSIADTAKSIWTGITSFLGNTWNTISTAATNTWNGIKSVAGTTWNSIKDVIVNPMKSLNGLLGDIWSGITSTLSNAWNGLVTTASDIFSRVKDAILSPFKNLHIPLPHFSFSIKHTTIAGIKMPYPDIDVKWYAEGGIFTSPQIIGVGEAGPEAVVPLEDFREIMFNTPAGLESRVVIEVPIYLDGKEIARITTPEISRIQEREKFQGLLSKGVLNL